MESQVLVRLKQEEHDRLVAEADAAGITLAALARRRLAGVRVIARTDAALIRELRRLGGLALLAIRTPRLVASGHLVLRDIRRAIAFLSDADAHDR
jgi:hypothetical protein